MKYLKLFERFDYEMRFDVGDYVKILKNSAKSMYSNSSTYILTDVFEIEERDVSDSTYGIVSITNPLNNFWVFDKDLRKARKFEIDTQKYNL